MPSSKSLFIIVACLILVASVGLVFKFGAGFSLPYMIINGQKIFIELADTPEKRKQGLSGRESMAQDRGMLFVFPQPGLYSFWMKDMKFGLDFVFINGDKVVDVIEDVPFPRPGEPPQSVRAEKEFDKVLELNAGLIEKFNINPGDLVSFFLREI